MDIKVYQNKELVIAEYLTGNTTLRKLGKKYNVNFQTVHSWIVKYKGKSKKTVINLDVESNPLPTDIKQLQAELRKAQLKNKLLEAIIDTAEEQLGIDIRKKSGTKQ